MVVENRFTGDTARAHRWYGNFKAFVRDMLDSGEVITELDSPAKQGQWVVRYEGEPEFAAWSPWLFNAMFKPKP